MNAFLKIISLIGLVLTMVPPILIFLGEIDLNDTKMYMAIGMVAWFASAPFWVNKNQDKKPTTTNE